MKTKTVKTIKTTKTVYRITSPSNFSPDPNIEHGTSKMYTKVPNWAKDNDNICVEELDVKQLTLAEKKELSISSKKVN